MMDGQRDRQTDGIAVGIVLQHSALQAMRLRCENCIIFYFPSAMTNKRISVLKR